MLFQLRLYQLEILAIKRILIDKVLKLSSVFTVCVRTQVVVTVTENIQLCSASSGKVFSASDLINTIQYN